MKGGNYPGVSCFTDKCGRIRWRYRKKGQPTVMLHAELGTEEFERQYALALAGRGAEIPKSTPDKRGCFRASSAHTKSLGWVYFMCADRGPIKIGFSTDPVARLANINTAHVRQLRIAGLLRGTMRDEVEMHERWQHLRIRREWFRRDKELLSFIRSIENGKQSVSFANSGQDNG